MFSRNAFRRLNAVVKTDCRSRLYSSRNILKLHQRGLLQEIFPNNSAQEVLDLCNGGPQCVYSGFDPTAKSLHIGNLLILINLMHWRERGHHVIALVGGATGKVGDPSGRSKERQQLSEEAIKLNTNRITSSIERLFNNHEKYFCKESLKPVRILNNTEWWDKMSALDFVCGVGRHFRVGMMMSRSCVAARSGLSLMELSYQAIQGYDWLHLFKTYNCRFQIGGNDQMGNIVSGHDLISRELDQPVYGLTAPLVTSESGDKYGKSAGDAVWLEEDMTSAFDLYQFLLRTADSKVESLLKLFTFLPPPSLDQILAEQRTRPEKRRGQQTLAENVVRLVHGEEGLGRALRATKALYGGDVTSLGSMTREEVISTLQGATVVDLLLQPGITIRDLVLSAKCFLSIADADRIMKAGGLRVNHKKTQDPDEVLTENLHILPNFLTVIRVGKKNYWIIKWLK